MKILTVKDKLRDQKIFSLQDIYTIFPDFRQETLYDWENQGYVKKIRNNYYTFSDVEFQDWDYFIISNKIYEPSYISLESALNYYGIIPEAVLKFTSITTRKTNNFETDFGTYTYRSVRNDLFFGYKLIEQDNIGIKIAEPEKVILDYLYLNTSVKNIYDFESLRFNTEVFQEVIDQDKLLKYLKIFSNKKLSERIDLLINYIGANA